MISLKESYYWSIRADGFVHLCSSETKKSIHVTDVHLADVTLLDARLGAKYPLANPMFAYAATFELFIGMTMEEYVLTSDGKRQIEQMAQRKFVLPN